MVQHVGFDLLFRVKGLAFRAIVGFRLDGLSPWFVWHLYYVKTNCSQRIA